MSYMYMYFGAPGCGKSTYAAKLVAQSLRKKRKVYTNFPVKGALRLDEASIGVRQLEHCLLIIDEAGLAYNNRDFKSFPRAALEFFKLHRHYDCDVVFFSQGWDDCDKKIRTLCTRYYNMYKLGPFTLLRKFEKRVGVDDKTKQIIDEYYTKSILSGGLGFLFRPLYYKYFDSWNAPTLAARTDIPWYDVDTSDDNNSTDEPSEAPV